MTLKDTNFGRIVVELNNFTDLINPKAIAEFEEMPEVELRELSQESSIKGEVAKWYLFLVEGMRIISAPSDEE